MIARLPCREIRGMRYARSISGVVLINGSGMDQGSPKQSLEASLTVCLGRIGAVAIDLTLWLFLSIVVLWPGFVATVLIVFGYLQNFTLLFESVLNLLFLYLFGAVIGLAFFTVYYPCRFESSIWQGTLGKFVLHLECMNKSGETESFSRIALRLILQALVIGMLAAIVCLFLSRDFRELVMPITTGVALPDLAEVFLWIDRLIPLTLLAPYAVALVTPKNQTLIDLMVGRIVAMKTMPTEKQSFSQLSRTFVRILLPLQSLRPAKNIVLAITGAFAVVWFLASALILSTFGTLPVAMSRVDRLVESQNLNAIEEYRRDTLFKNLDFAYGWLANSTNASEKFREQCLSKAILVDPHRHFYWYWRAQLYLAQRHYQKALADISEAIKNYDRDNTSVLCQTMFCAFRLRVVPDENLDLGALYSLRASVEQKLGDKQSAFEDLTKAIGLNVRAEAYKEWLSLHEVIKKQREAEAKIRLAKATVMANEAYRVLLKSPARFQQKKDIYNQMIDLNNEGVAAIVQNDFDKAIEKFQLALKLGLKVQHDGMLDHDDFDTAFKKWQTALDLNSKNELALRNLSIAYNGKAKTMRDPKMSLMYLHRALYFDPLNEPARVNTADVIAKLGLNPRSFDDHIKLAETAVAENDLQGAVAEYTLALEIHNDIEAQKKLALFKTKLSAASSAK